MTARRLSEDATATEIEATVWNRSRWPARVTSHLSFRNYFTLDGQVGAKQVRATVSGAESARLSAVRQGTDKSVFVEIAFPDDAVEPLPFFPKVRAGCSGTAKVLARMSSSRSFP